MLVPVVVVLLLLLMLLPLALLLLVAAPCLAIFASVLGITLGGEALAGAGRRTGGP